MAVYLVPDLRLQKKKEETESQAIDFRNRINHRKLSLAEVIVSRTKIGLKPTQATI